MGSGAAADDVVVGEVEERDARKASTPGWRFDSTCASSARIWAIVDSSVLGALGAGADGAAFISRSCNVAPGAMLYALTAYIVSHKYETKCDAGARTQGRVVFQDCTLVDKFEGRRRERCAFCECCAEV